MSFPGGSDGKESACSAAGPDLTPELGRCPGEGNGNPLQFLHGKSHGQGSLVGYIPWDRKDLCLTEGLILSLSMHYNKCCERGNLELFFSGRGRAGHRLGGRGRIEDLLEKVVGKWPWKGNKDLCRWRFGRRLFQVENVAHVKAPRGGLIVWEVLVISSSLAVICGEE